MGVTEFTQWIEANPEIATAVIVAVLAAVLEWVTGFFTWLGSRLWPTVQEASQTVQSHDQSGGQTMGNVQGDVVQYASDPKSLEVFVKTLKDTENKLRDDLKSERSDKDDLHRQLGALYEKLANPERAIEEAVKTSKDMQARLMRVSNEVDAEALAAAQAAVAQFDFDQADAIFEQIAARNELAVQQTASAELGRAEIAEQQIRWHDACAHAKRAYDLGQEVEALKLYARMAWRLARNEEGVGLHQQLVRFAADDHGEESVEYATAINNLAELYRAQRRYEDAEPLYIQAIEIERAALGEEHPDFATSLNNLAVLYEAQGRYDAAEPLYKQAMEIRRVALGEEHPVFAGSLHNLASLYYDQGQYEDALPLIDRAVAIWEAALPAGHPHIDVARAWQADIRAALGDA